MKRNLTSGGLLMILGFIALSYVHSARPPANYGELLMRATQKNSFYFREPFYQLFMGVSGLILLWGGIQAYSGWKAVNSEKGSK